MLIAVTGPNLHLRSVSEDDLTADQGPRCHGYQIRRHRRCPGEVDCHKLAGIFYAELLAFVLIQSALVVRLAIGQRDMPFLADDNNVEPGFSLWLITAEKSPASVDSLILRYGHVLPIFAAAAV